MGTTLSAKQIKQEYAKLFKMLDDPEFIKQQREEDRRKDEERQRQFNELWAKIEKFKHQ